MRPSRSRPVTGHWSDGEAPVRLAVHRIASLLVQHAGIAEYPRTRHVVAVRGVFDQSSSASSNPSETPPPAPSTARHSSRRRDSRERMWPPSSACRPPVAGTGWTSEPPASLQGSRCRDVLAPGRPGPYPGSRSQHPGGRGRAHTERTHAYCERTRLSREGCERAAPSGAQETRAGGTMSTERKRDDRRCPGGDPPARRERNEALTGMARMGADAFGYTADLLIDRGLAQLLRLAGLAAQQLHLLPQPALRGGAPGQASPEPRSTP